MLSHPILHRSRPRVSGGINSALHFRRGVGAEFFRVPKYIDRLRLEGLQIHLPPRHDNTASANSPASRATPAASSACPAAFILDAVIADFILTPSYAEFPDNPTKGESSEHSERQALTMFGILHIMHMFSTRPELRFAERGRLQP